MILYRDYFDEEEALIPYVSGEEHIREYLHLLDMLLEQYLSRGKDVDQDEDWPGGFAAVQAEVRNHIQLSPFLRYSDEKDPVFVMQIAMARSHLKKREAQTAGRVFLPLAEVRRIFELNDYELLALLLALAVQADAKYANLFAFLQHDMAQKLPTIGLLEALYHQTELRSMKNAVRLSAGGKMDLYMLELKRNMTHNMMQTPLILKPQMRSFLLEQKTEPVDGMDSILSIYREEGIPVFFPRELTFMQAIFDDCLMEQKVSFLKMEGKPGTGRRILAGQLAQKNHCELSVIDIQLFAGLQSGEAWEYVQRILLQQRLKPGILYLKNCSGENMSSVSVRKLLRMLKQELTGVLVCIGISCGEKTELEENIPLLLQLDHTTEQQRLAMWQYLTEGMELAEDVVLEELADCYEIPYCEMAQVVRQAAEEARLTGEKLGRELLRKFLYQLNQNIFGELASQVRIAYNWEDIQLEESQIRILRMACDRYKLRNRAGENWGLFRKNAYGNGISILLYGPPGTGKTMAAQIIANEVGIPLYRIDLSRVYSKYIGETEKNLSLIFDRAKDANIILFFDEADSLFSKRTEVSNANDRYSNSETAYLLQKMEEYNGISILATNLYQNFDNAFLRRITFAVHFERPDVETREYLWRTILPEEVPVEKNIDFRFLAEEFEVSGSNIKAILYNAAYMAAAQGRSVGMEHIVRSVKCELDKLGQMVNAADFGIYAGYLL